MIKRVEKFRWYCPTQDKFETVEQEYYGYYDYSCVRLTYKPGLMLCPHISFRGGTCELWRKCPVVMKGDWIESIE